MNKTQVTEIANQVFEKISKYYGLSNHQATPPYLEIENSPYSDAESDTFGEYQSWNNELVIYWTKLESFEDITRTIIHEYQHYLQSPIWMARYYNMGYDYNDHPYEVAAYREEENWENFV
jgi:hypothetical protein